MSRYEHVSNKVSHGITSIAYGHDAIYGFFFQAFDDVDDDPKIDLDSLFHNLTGPALADKLDEFGVHVPAMHRTSMMLDLPF